VELVTLRCGVRRRLDSLPDFRERPTDLDQPGTQEVRAAAGGVAARLVSAAAVGPGERIDGPALIEGYSSTTWVPSGWVAVRDIHGNTRMARKPL
jgi:N-methylhydantoinase A